MTFPILPSWMVSYKMMEPEMMSVGVNNMLHGVISMLLRVINMLLVSYS